MRDVARSAVLEVADSAAQVGDFLRRDLIGDATVMRFASLHPGYPGWQWCVSLSGDERAATINEVWMEPGEGALPVPAWKPWSARVRPGDLGPGDAIATAPDDPRLEPGYAAVAVDDEPLDALWEPGLGRERVLSAEGLIDAADRWRRGDSGPDSQMARLADFPCSTCAWLLPIGGPLGQAFGVCAHDMSPSDGHVVALDHGCGAHSDVRVEPTHIPVTDMLIDDERIVPVSRDALRRETSAAPAHAVAAEGDVQGAEQAEDDAGVGDVTPPEDTVIAEDGAE